MGKMATSHTRCCCTNKQTPKTATYTHSYGAVGRDQSRSDAAVTSWANNIQTNVASSIILDTVMALRGISPSPSGPDKQTTAAALIINISLFRLKTAIPVVAYSS